jgi:hypothetical protein
MLNRISVDFSDTPSQATAITNISDTKGPPHGHFSIDTFM